LERTARGRIGRAKAGFVPGGKRTLGYTYVKHADKGAHYEIHPEEAALVQRIFHLYVQDRLSLFAIAQQLTREGIPTPGARGICGPKHTRAPGHWLPGTLLEILRNATYTGIMHFGKTVRLPGRKNPDKKTRYLRTPHEQWIAIPVPPIIDQALFAVAQAQRTRNAQLSKRNRKRSYLLCNQRLRCRQCGRVMSGQYHPQKQWRYYRCNGRQYQAPHACKGMISAAKIEQAVWEVVEKALNTPSLIAMEVERRKQGTTAQQGALTRERHSFEGQVAQCDKELHKWTEMYMNDIIDIGTLKGKNAEILTRRASAERELARLDEQARLLEQIELETASLVAYCQRVRDNLTRFDDDEKRLALDALQITVYWSPDTPIEIIGNIPVSIASTASGDRVPLGEGAGSRNGFAYLAAVTASSRKLS
jgi:site-specific DNA recombinase